MDNKIICGIYKIQNKITKEIYIGQSINILERFKKHKLAYDNFDIHKAIKQYGVDNFTFEIIEECPKEKLNEREKYWIKYYDSYNNGYNMTSGGAGTLNTNNKKVKQYDIEGNFIKSFISENEAAKMLNTDARYISNCCLHKNNTILDYQFCFEGDETSIKKNPKTNSGYDKIPVSQYDLNGNFITTYNSILEASKVTFCDTKTISKCCKKEAFRAGNFLWTYLGDLPPKPYNSKKAHSTTSKKVNQYDLNGNYIRTFDSCLDAAKSVGLKGQSCIIRVCKGIQKTSAGYIWKYAE